MSLGKIYSYPNNWRVARARAAAVLGGKDFEVVETTMDQFKTEYASKFPLGMMPGFEATDGTCISDSMAIATYGAMAAPEGKLLSTDKAVAAQIAQWLAFADSELTPLHNSLMFMVVGFYAYAKPTFTSIAQKLDARLATLNKYLEDKTYLVGDRITLADIAVAGTLFGAFTGKGQADAAVRAKVPNVVRFFETIVKSSKLAPIFGEVEYVETAVQYQAPKKDAPVKKAEAPKAAKAPKEKKPVEKDDDEEEPDVPAEPKVKNPLDDLPKSNFNLENWKRVYSNEDTPKAMEYFYENFDTEGFSIWRIDYKYPTELTQVFMSANLIGGLFARLEASRKYLFGSVGVLGKTNDSVISGLFVTRGQSIEDTISVAPDWESYTYTKLDTKSDADKEYIYKAMEWTLTLEGKQWADGKNFK